MWIVPSVSLGEVILKGLGPDDRMDGAACYRAVQKYVAASVDIRCYAVVKVQHARHNIIANSVEAPRDTLCALYRCATRRRENPRCRAIEIYVAAPRSDVDNAVP